MKWKSIAGILFQRFIKSNWKTKLLVLLGGAVAASLLTTFTIGILLLVGTAVTVKWVSSLLTSSSDRSLLTKEEEFSPPNEKSEQKSQIRYGEVIED